MRSVVIRERWPHLKIGIRAALVRIYLWNKALKVLRSAMKIEGLTIRPFLNENEVPRILIVNEEFIGDVERLRTRKLDELTVQRHHDIYGIESDEVLGNHFQHDEPSLAGFPVASCQISL